MKVSEIKVIMVVALSVGISFSIPWPVAQQDSAHATIKVVDGVSPRISKLIAA
jgi:hypothetical protein